MIRRTIRRWAVLTAAAVAVLTVSACTSDQGEQMTPQDSRQKLITAIQDTAALLAADGWDEISPPAWGPCSLDTGEGANVTWAYAREPLTDHESNAKKVADYWESLGMEVRIVSDPVYSVYATGGPVEGLAFHTEPGLYGLSGTSQCVPGDAVNLINQEPEGS
jgi:hypothetical protein